MRSIAAMRSLLTVKPTTYRGRPPARTIAPGAPLTIAGSASGANGAPVDRISRAALTYDECAVVLSEVLGRSIRYADPTPWHYWRRMHRRGMPTAMIAVTLGIYTAARFGLAAGLTDDVARIVRRPPIDFATFAADHADAWRPDPKWH